MARGRALDRLARGQAQATATRGAGPRIGRNARPQRGRQGPQGRAGGAQDGGRCPPVRGRCRARSVSRGRQTGGRRAAGQRRICAEARRGRGEGVRGDARPGGEAALRQPEGLSLTHILTSPRPGAAVMRWTRRQGRRPRASARTRRKRAGGAQRAAQRLHGGGVRLPVGVAGASHGRNAGAGRPFEPLGGRWRFRENRPGGVTTCAYTFKASPVANGHAPTGGPFQEAEKRADTPGGLCPRTPRTPAPSPPVGGEPAR